MISQQTYAPTDPASLEIHPDASPAHSSAAENSTRRVSKLSEKKARILVIEQEKASANLLRQLLSTCGDVKVVASNKNIAEVSAHFDPSIVLLCLDLRDKHGLTLCKELKQKDANGEMYFNGDVVLMTSRKTDAALLRSCRKIADGQIAKPLESQAVLSLVRHLIEVSKETNNEVCSVTSNEIREPKEHVAASAPPRLTSVQTAAPTEAPKRESLINDRTTNANAFAQRHSQFAGPTEIVAKTFGSDTEIFNSLKLILQCRGLSDKSGTSVASFARRIAVQLQRNANFADTITLSFLEHLHLAAQLYELGCPPIDRDSIESNRMPRAVELALVKKHADIGSAIFDEYVLRNPDSVFLKVARDVALSHRERWDGRGYPSGHCETDIPLSARIVAVANTFHALTAERRFGNSHSPEEARNIISAESNKQFDPLVVAAFEEAFRDLATQCSGLREQPFAKPDLELSNDISFDNQQCESAPATKKTLEPSLLSRPQKQESASALTTRLKQGLISCDNRVLADAADDTVQYAKSVGNEELQSAARNLLIMLRQDCLVEAITMSVDFLIESLDA